MARATVSIGSFNFPEPDTYNATTEDVTEGKRNSKAVLLAEVIREDLAKVELGYKTISGEEWSKILKKFNSKYGGSFYNDVTFLNQVTNDWETRELYVGNRTAGVMIRDDDGVVYYSNAKISLIEA